MAKSEGINIQLLKKRAFWGVGVVLGFILCLFMFLSNRVVKSFLDATLGAYVISDTIYQIKVDYFSRGRATANTDIPDNDEDTNNNPDNNKNFALPAIKSDDQIIKHTAYTLAYEEEHEQAKWVAYKLEQRNLEKGKNSRDGESFKPDPAVSSGSALPSDYAKSGYDRGHLAPAGDFNYDKNLLTETFFMSNMSPQKPELNRGKWNELEQQVRYWLRFDKELYIVSGPIFAEKMKKIGKKNKISVPVAYFKVILDIRNKKAIAFIMPNEVFHDNIQNYIVSIDKIEAKTGIDFFPQLSKDKVLEKKLESSETPEGWF